MLTSHISRLFGLAFVLATALGWDCGEPSQPVEPQPMPETAYFQPYIDLEVKDKCPSLSIHWHLVPLTLTGAKGINTTFDVDQSWPQDGYSFGGICRYSASMGILGSPVDQAGGLRAGTWQIVISEPYTASTSCIKNLRNGYNSFAIDLHKTGCR